MHVTHQTVADFCPPFHSSPFTWPNDSSKYVMSVDSISRCVTAAKAALETFINLDIDTLRVLPPPFLLRIGYCLIILQKTLFAVHSKTSPLYKMIDPANLNVSSYLGEILAIMARISVEGKQRVPNLFLNLMKNFRVWNAKAVAKLGVVSSADQKGSDCPLQFLSGVAEIAEQPQSMGSPNAPSSTDPMDFDEISQFLNQEDFWQDFMQTLSMGSF